MGSSAESISGGWLAPDTPFSQIVFEDKQHEARAILTRMFMYGLHKDDDPDFLWGRLCDIGGLEQACLLAGGAQFDDPAKCDIILTQHTEAAEKGSVLAQFQLGRHFASQVAKANDPLTAALARMWLNRAVDNDSTEDATIFGTAHYRKLASDVLAELDTLPPASSPAAPLSESPAQTEQLVPFPANDSVEPHRDLKSREQEVRSIIARKFILGECNTEEEWMPLWDRLCDLIGMDQAISLCYGHLLGSGGNEQQKHTLDAVLEQVDTGCLIAQCNLGLHYAASYYAESDWPRDEGIARIWLGRALENPVSEDSVIFGAVHWKALATEALAKLDAPRDVHPAAAREIAPTPQTLAKVPAPTRQAQPKSALVQFFATLVAGPLGLFYSNIWLAIGLTIAAILTVGIFYVSWPLIWLVANIVGQIEVSRQNKVQA